MTTAVATTPTPTTPAPPSSSASASRAVALPPAGASPHRRSQLALVVVAVAAVAVAVVLGVIGGVGRVVELDATRGVVLGVVALVALVVLRFAHRYLDGDAGRANALRALGSTVAGAATVVVADDLGLLALAWTATSLALHGLLTHHHERPAAVAAAHKKFVLSRVADVCVIGGVVCLAAAYDTTHVSAIVAAAERDASLTGLAHAGIVLIALAAVLRCAQLPFHGWLIQVMEAPTPVSALLHVGVVNLGGVVLLQFAVLVDGAPAARAVLLAFGIVTAVVGALVMTTRVSVKVALAWSTCAQMGIMLVQCGLGAWELALLHLVAHSLYKAHAFLRAGSTVRRSTIAWTVPGHGRPSAVAMAAGVGIAAAVTGLAAAAWVRLPSTSSLGRAGWLFVGALALAAVPLATAWVVRPGRRRAARLVALPVISLALHEVAARIAPHGTEAPMAAIVAVAVALAALFASHVAMTVAPDAALVRRARPWLFRGLFIDEAFTRALLRGFPPPSPTLRSTHLTPPTSTIRLVAE